MALPPKYRSDVHQQALFNPHGARVAVNKSFTFATSPTTRHILHNYKWDEDGFTIPVTNSFRDLGTHLNFTRSNSGVTLTNRMLKGG